MDNKQRIQMRIARDKAKRTYKRKQKYADADNLNKIITLQNYYQALRKCQRGVMWKNSVLRYTFHAIEEIYFTQDSLDNLIIFFNLVENAIDLMIDNFTTLPTEYLTSSDSA